jgi:N-acetylneuraminic acid mutarotase
MKKIISLLGLGLGTWLLVLGIVLSACEKWDLELQEFPEIKTGTFKFGTNPWEVKLSGEISDLTKDGFVQNHGHVWSYTSKRPTIEENAGQTIFEKRGNGSFQSEIGGLVPKKTYFYRAYIVYDNEVVYAENTEVFNTESLNPTLTIDSLVRLEETAAIKVFCTISDLPVGLRIKSFGIAWGADRSPEIVTGQLIPEQGVAVTNPQIIFESEIQPPGGDLFLRPYLLVGDEVFYGESWFYHQGDLWTQKAEFPGVPRSNAFGFAVHSKGYVGGGTNGSNLTDLWEYDPQSDYWTQKADFPGDPRRGAAGFAIDRKGYIGTGSDGNEPKNDFWEYDPKSDVWLRKADVPGEARWNAVGFSIGPKGYIGTGSRHPAVSMSDFWEYDPKQDTWTRKTDFPGGPRSEATGLSIGPRGYVGAGRDNASKPVSDFWEYDPQTDAWKQVADYGGGPVTGAVGFSIGLKGYVGTGAKINPADPDDRPAGAEFWVYDALFGNWSKVAGLSKERSRSRAVSFSIDARGYVATGAASNGNLSDLWIYVP